MTDQPPTPRYRYTLIVEGNTHDEIEHELLVCTRGGYLLDSDYYQRDEWHVVGGHTDSRMEHVAPDMTPERYGAELEAWFAARAKLRKDHHD